MTLSDEEHNDILFVCINFLKRYDWDVEKAKQKLKQCIDNTEQIKDKAGVCKRYANALDIITERIDQNALTVIILKELPTVSEALKIKKEAEIVRQQGIELFLSRPVRLVIEELKRRNRETGYDQFIALLEAFNYGYIMGKRAERKRKGMNYYGK